MKLSLLSRLILMPPLLLCLSCKQEDKSEEIIDEVFRESADLLKTKIRCKLLERA